MASGEFKATVAFGIVMLLIGLVQIWIVKWSTTHSSRVPQSNSSNASGMQSAPPGRQRLLLGTMPQRDLEAQIPHPAHGIPPGLSPGRLIGNPILQTPLEQQYRDGPAEWHILGMETYTVGEDPLTFALPLYRRSRQARRYEIVARG
jgi:hypothetical protein